MNLEGNWMGKKDNTTHARICEGNTEILIFEG